MSSTERLHHALVSLANDPEFHRRWSVDPVAALVEFNLDPDDMSVLADGGPEVLRLIGRAMGGEPTPLAPMEARAAGFAVPPPWKEAADRVHRSPESEQFNAILDLLSVIDPNLATP